MLLTNKLLQIALLSSLLSGCSALDHEIDKTKDLSANKATSSRSRTYEPDASEIGNIISKKEIEYGLPAGLLRSIASVESDTKPYAVNKQKKSHYFSSKAEATNCVETALSEGCTNLSIGCMQLHYSSHKEHFRSINDMLTPKQNIDYAARMLKGFYNRYGSWEQAIKHYHAGKRKQNNTYYEKVMRKYKSI